MALFYPQRRPLAIGNLYFSAKFAQTTGPGPCIFSGPPLLPRPAKAAGTGAQPAPPPLQTLLYNPLYVAPPPLQTLLYNPLLQPLLCNPPT